jgi:hypothetical protein
VDSDSARTAEEPADMADTTAVYVVDLLSLPPASGGLAPGYNLDDLDSGAGSIEPGADCEAYNADYESLYDAGHVGVDNALTGLLMTIEGFIPVENCPGGVRMGCLDAILAQQIAEGTVLLMIEVSGINSYTYDSEVSMQLVMGGLPTGTTAPMLGGDGKLAPGQTFTRVMELGPAVTGDIFAGRLRATTSLITLTIDAGDFSIPLMISNPQVRFNITADALAEGQIGGYVQNEDIIAAASAIAPDQVAAVQGIVENVADIEPMADAPETCSAVSVGIVFGGTTASF